MARYELSTVWSHREDAESARPTALKCGVALTVYLKLLRDEKWPDDLLPTLEENISSLDERSILLLNWTNGKGIEVKQATTIDENEPPVDILLAQLLSIIEKMEHKINGISEV